MLGRLNGEAKGEIDVSLDKLAQIVGLAREFDNDDGCPDLDEAGELISSKHDAEADGSTALRRAIDELSEEEQAVLVALVWIGRGDYRAEDFDEALTLAFDRRKGPTSNYLLEFPRLGDLLEQGAAACGADLANWDQAAPARPNGRA